MSISLGLAENYAMLGNKYLFMSYAGTITGFMGSNFLSYPPVPNVDSNGIQLIYGNIPNAPIVNGAAAKQAIDDVKTAIPQYQAVTPQYTGTNILNTSYNNPGCYNIIGNLTSNGVITLNGSATDIYVFNVVGVGVGYVGVIDIHDNIILTGELLPQNIIFIASNFISIYNSTVYGIYISTGNYVVIDTSTLIGRIISTDETTDGSVANQTSTITAP